MKALKIIVLIQSLLLYSTSFAQLPCIQKSANGKESIIRLCNSVEDIICKDVKLSERRSCDEKDKNIFNKNLSGEEIWNYTKGCFTSAATSFKAFFTEFIPSLVKAMWKLTFGEDDAKKEDNRSLWEKTKGMYESVRSVSADIYEDFSRNPSAFMSKLWSKISDKAGELVANYDCLKPQVKIEKICGFVAEWVMPPMILAKILFRGVKLIKAKAIAAGIFADKKIAKYGRALELGDEATMKIMEFEAKYKNLGYTPAEFEIIKNSAEFKKIKITDLKPVTTVEGKKQRDLLLGDKKIAVTMAAIDAAKKTIPKPPKFDFSSDYITLESIGPNGKKIPTPAQIIERLSDGTKEYAYRLRVIDPNNGKLREIILKKEQAELLYPKHAGEEVAKQMAEAHAKAPHLKSAQEEFDQAAKHADMIAANQRVAEKLKLIAKTEEASPKPLLPAKKIDGVDVKELDPLDPEVQAIFNPKPAMTEIDASAHQYQDGVDFVPVPNAKDLKIVKTPEPKKPVPEKNVLESRPDVFAPALQSNYITLMATNTMGNRTQSMAQIVGKTKEGVIEKFIVKIWDPAAQRFTEKRMTLRELESAGAKEGERVESEFKKLKSQGYELQPPDAI